VNPAQEAGLLGRFSGVPIEWKEKHVYSQSVRLPVSVVVFAFVNTAAVWAEKAPAADPKKVEADPQFAVQGEYAGEISSGDRKVKFGIQIIALGEAKYRAVVHRNGLPGETWKKEDRLGATESQVIDGVITFKETGGTAITQWKDGVLVISDPTRPDYGGTLKKVIRKSPTLAAKPPKNAKILFGGKDRNDFPPEKVTEDGLLMQGATSRTTFKDCTLHLEFLLPFEPKGRGQGRGNSGCYMQGRYEVQILDSFGLEAKDNEAGGIYEVSDPKVNMCFPPMGWQTYDIDFTAPRFDASGKKTRNARMTVRFNGVLVQKDVEIPGPTRAAIQKESPEPGPVYLQDHSHPVRFRNIWIVEKESTPTTTQARWRGRPG
jgi:3-keto-disaccharide hydrolase